MSTKTFKVGERGYHPKIRLVSGVNAFQVQLIDWDDEVDGAWDFRYGNLTDFESFMWEEVDCYHADQMVHWVKFTKEFKAFSKLVQSDPFSTYSFN